MSERWRTIKSVSVFILFTLVITTGCRHNYTPKPHGYFRIVFPDKKYTSFDTCYPYSFNYPAYARMTPDSSVNTEPYWVNMEFPQFNGKLHLSYKKVNGNFNELMEDSRRLAYKHTIKADAINEQMFIDDSSMVFGVLYEIKGEAASALQFFATDSTKHFLRGSLYFNVTPNKDSLAPVIDFVKQDIIELMETLRWKENQK